MMKSSRRRLLRDSVSVAALMGMPSLLDALFLPVSAAAAPLGRPKESGKGQRFAHPGILHSAEDLKAIRERVKSGAEPWKAAWEQLKADKALEGEPKPVVHVFRGPYAKPDIGSTEIQHDSGAAYGHALIGALSPDPAESEAHYKQAAAYLDAWSGTLQSIDGHDQKLLCGMTGYKFAAAAELLRFAGNTPRGVWSDKQHQAAKTMLTSVFVPPIRELYPAANGNWDAAMLSTLLAIAIFTDDRPLFDHAVDLYLNEGGNGAITNYVYPSGQIEETTRDQGHVHMGIGLLSTACWLASVQGVDLYSAADNRLALGFEYTAKYNLGEDVPCDGGVPGAGARGKFAPVYEKVYQHYALEKGLPMPYTRRVVEQRRPEGYNGAFPSWDTLTACRNPDLSPKKGDILADALAASLPPKNGEREVAVTSPSGSLTATIGVRGGKLTYTLRDKSGREMLQPSTAGIEFGGGITPLDGGFDLWDVAASRREIDRPRLYGQNGEQAPALAPHLPFEQRMLILRERAAPHRILRAELRVYDAGIALRLTLPPNRDPATTAKTAREKTEFVFPDGAVVYESYENEDEFRPVAVSALKPGAWLPFTARAGAKGPYLSILEVDETGGAAPQTLLSPSPSTPNAVVTDARGPVSVLVEASTAFPWRVLLASETPAKLAASARVATSLWRRSVLPDNDVAWIQPGPAIRTGLSTAAAVSCIDFAAANGLRYILFDAGWYGPERAATSDATKVARADLDMPQVIAHGKEKGIGVFLYVNKIAAEKQISEIVPLYEKWGVAGIKFGFMDVGPADKMQFLRDAAALCAQHHLLVDIHDAYRPVGVSGLYPNLLTQEGVRGNEHMPTPRHNCTLPFTRFLSGPADYTICYRFPKLKTTDAHQMALSVLYYSPLTLVYWYGKPEEYEGLPDREFFHGLPTVWDETVWLGGEIGEWAAVARRSGREWFVAAITNESARTIPLSFDFLPEGKSFTLHAYADTPASAPGAPITHGVSRIAITEQKHVRRGAPALQAALPAAGGIALRLKAE